jgi:hypothetical protein
MGDIRIQGKVCRHCDYGAKISKGASRSLLWPPACTYIGHIHQYTHKHTLSVCLSISLSVCLSCPCVYAVLSVRVSVCLSISLSLWLCVYRACMCVCGSIDLSVCLCVCVSIDLSVCLCVCVSIDLSVRVSVCLSISWSVYAGISLSCLCVYRSLCPCVCGSIDLPVHAYVCVSLPHATLSVCSSLILYQFDKFARSLFLFSSRALSLLTSLVLCSLFPHSTFSTASRDICWSASPKGTWYRSSRLFSIQSSPPQALTQPPRLHLTGQSHHARKALCGP